MIVRLSIKHSAIAFLVLSILSFNCLAQQLPAPSGRIILTITGEIGAYNQVEANPDGAGEKSSAVFDLQMLESPGLLTVATETPWTEDTVEFEGVLMRDVLEMVRSEGKTVHAVALDDYMVELPVEDFLDYDVILATRINGKPMKVRENGPLWVIYPWSDVPALRRPHYYSRSIWQLKSLKLLP